MSLEAWLSRGNRQILVIDDDAATTQTVLDFAGRYEGLGVTIKEDGRHGVAVASNGNVDLVVMGWKVRSMPGPALFNRLRMHEKHATTPILVVSDAVRRKDFRLLDEFPCTRLEEKPLSEPRLAKAIDGLVTEGAWLEEHSRTIAEQFKAALGDPSTLMRSLKATLAQAPNPMPVILLIGDVLVARGHVAAAEAVFKRALEIDGKNLMALNGLGKSLYKQNKHEEAAAALRVATRESQANIGRLCLLGEMELAQINPDAARLHFDRALAIDDDNPRARAGNELAETLTDHVRQHAGSALPSTFASVCNTMAITLVRAGQIDKGINQYKAALQLVTESYASAQIMFNLGLGFLRGKKPDEAHAWFVQAETKSQGRLAKARKYRHAVEAKGINPTADAAFDLATIDQEMAEQSKITFDEATLDEDIAQFEAELADDMFEEEKI